MKTKIKCWWCVHDVSNVYKLPINYNMNNDSFTCIGNFCSWECMKAYNLNDQDHCKHVRSSYITMMFRKMNKNNDFIECAPPRETLDIFGGPLSITEFRNNKRYIYKKIPNMINELSTKFDKQINFKWIDKDEADKQFNNTTLKNKINPIKIKSLNTNDTKQKTLGIFDTFVDKST